MTIPELEKLRIRLSKGEVVPVVLVAGGDDAVRDGAVDLVNEAFRGTASSVSILRLDAEPAKSDAWQRVADVAAALSLFGEGTLAVVSGCDAAQVPEVLKPVLASPPAHLRLVLLGGEKARSGPLQKGVEACGGEVVAPEKIRDNQAGELVFAAARAAGLALDSRAAAVLADLAGTDRSAIETAVRTLLEFKGVGNRVTEEDLSGLVQRTKKPAPWDLDEAISRRDLATAIRVATRDLADAKREADAIIPLFHRVTRHVRKLLVTKALVARGAGFPEAKAEMGLKVPFQWQRLTEGAGRYSQAELESYLKAAPALEIQVKRGNVPAETATIAMLSRLLRRRGK